MDTLGSREEMEASDSDSAVQMRTRGELLDMLLRKVLESFADLDLFSEENAPTFFLVYAHDVREDLGLGKADATVARHLIDWLKILRAKVFSDRSTRSELWSTREEGVVRDILLNQFCLLPRNSDDGSDDSITRVDKVIVCCSEVLQRYYEDGRMKSFIEKVKECYHDAKSCGTEEVKTGIEKIVISFRDLEGFHHVLTELAFLEVRSSEEQQDHGIIPIKLNGASIKYLPFFKTGNPHWLTPQNQSKSIVHERQLLHRLLFNLLRRLFEDHHACIDEFEECYEKCTKFLTVEIPLPSPEDFDNLTATGIASGMGRLSRRHIAAVRKGQQTFQVFQRALLTSNIVPKQPKVVEVALEIAPDLALKSLAFPEMNHRRHDTERAYAKTCQWVIDHPSYTDWLEESSGILWIKGKPGSGKSTLMEFLLRDFEERDVCPQPIQISFFFHGRGADLQKSRLGMYRSLLHQLLQNKPTAGAKFDQAFQKRFRSEGTVANDWNWHTNELRRFFMDAVEQVAEQRAVNIFVDALDEASGGTSTDHASRQIVQDFHDLNDRLFDRGLPSKICFSCRHQPVIADNQGRDICVEDENEADIAIYVRNNFGKRVAASGFRGHYLAELQNTIIQGAKGVFQWAVLVVHLVVRCLNKGNSEIEIQQMVAEVPSKLGEVYRHILENVIDREDYPKTKRLMRLVCFAVRPLTVIEVCYAMCISQDEILGPVHSPAESDVQSEESMVKRISSLSGGLIESKQHKQHRIVQVIHQSVNDYLLKDGLQNLDGKPQDLVGESHHRLSLICANCIRTAEADISSGISYSAWPAVGAIGPFTDYAVTAWFLHAEKAEARGVPQVYLIAYSRHCPFILERWVKLYRSIKPNDHIAADRRPVESLTLLHIASESGLLSVVESLLSTNSKIEQTDSQGNRALHYASYRGQTQVVKALLDAEADVEAENNGGYTPLIKATTNQHVEIVRILLQKGADVNKSGQGTESALYKATLRGSRALIQLLLDNGAEVNAIGGQYGNALQAAADQGNQAIVKLLLDNGAVVNAQGGHYGNALQAAAFSGHKTIVQLLLDSGAEANAQGGYCGNALRGATYKGYQAIVQILLENGAENPALRRK